MDAAQWQQHHQQVAAYSRPMEEMIPIPNNNNNPSNINTSRAPSSSVAGDQKRSRPHKDQNLNCPRCNSTNTKFCYYNNYSLTQPRYFCKTCRRYWTQGGSLRNVPVGGGSRKNKRSSSSSSSSITSSSITTNTTPNNIIPSKLIPDLNPPNSLSHLITASHQNPKFLEGQDLNLAFPMQSIFHPNNNENNNHHEPINIMNNSTNHGNNSGNNHNNLSSNTTTNNNNNTSSNTTANTSSSHPISALELLRTGIASRGSSLNPYVPIPMPDSNTLYPSGFPNLQEFKTNMTNVFSPPPPPGGGDHNNMVGSAGDHNNNNGGARLLFPFADMNKLATSTPPSTNHHHHQDHIDDQSNKGSNDHHHHHNHHQGPTNGYWSGMLGGGTW